VESREDIGGFEVKGRVGSGGLEEH